MGQEVVVAVTEDHLAFGTGSRFSAASLTGGG